MGYDRPQMKVWIGSHEFYVGSFLPLFLSLLFFMFTLTPGLVKGQMVTSKNETKVTPPPTSVDALRRPAMVSNSTQTDDYNDDEIPFVMTGLFLAVAAACISVLAVVILIIGIICIIRCYWDRPSKDSGIFPYNGTDGYKGDHHAAYVPVFVDRKMAQSAQMFFYQFQKQQILAKDKENKNRPSVDSDSCSETETKDGHMPMVSCPGLALESGEDIEVRNPLFPEDIPTTPTWNGSSNNDTSNETATANTAHNTDDDNDVPVVGDDNDDREQAAVISPPPPSIASLSDVNPSLISPPISPLPVQKDEDIDEGHGDSINTSKTSEDTDDRKDDVTSAGISDFSSSSADGEKSEQMKSIVGDKTKTDHSPVNGNSRA